jgi:two-component system LytT family response regulator
LKGLAENGREALEKLGSQPFSLVLLDIMMPELDGFEVLDALAGVEGARPAIVFVTAYDEYAVKAFEVHALDYLLKPIDPERFRDAFERKGRLSPLVAKLPAFVVTHPQPGLQGAATMAARTGTG